MDKKQRARAFFGFFALLLCANSAICADSALEQREKFLEQCKSYLGTPYKYGGTTKAGMDCSGFVCTAAKESLGITLTRRSEDLYNSTARIEKADLQPGDLLFFKANKNINHVAVYLGNDTFIHSASDGDKTGVIISSMDENYWERTFAGCGQFLPALNDAELAALFAPKTQAAVAQAEPVPTAEAAASGAQSAADEGGAQAEDSKKKGGDSSSSSSTSSSAVSMKPREQPAEESAESGGASGSVPVTLTKADAAPNVPDDAPDTSEPSEIFTALPVAEAPATEAPAAGANTAPAAAVAQAPVAEMPAAASPAPALASNPTPATSGAPTLAVTPAPAVASPAAQEPSPQGAKYEVVVNVTVNGAAQSAPSAQPLDKKNALPRAEAPNVSVQAENATVQSVQVSAPASEQAQTAAANPPQADDANLFVSQPALNVTISVEGFIN